MACWRCSTVRHACNKAARRLARIKLQIHTFEVWAIRVLCIPVQCCDDWGTLQASHSVHHHPDLPLPHAQLVPEGYESGAVYTGALRILIYVYFPEPYVLADDLQKYRCGSFTRYGPPAQ